MRTATKISFICVLIFYLISKKDIFAQNLLESSNTMIYLNQDAFIKINGNLKTEGDGAINNNGTINITGNLISTSVDTSSNFYGSIIFTGNQDQSIEGSEGLKFKEVILEKQNERLNIETNVVIENYIDIVEGVINIGSSNIYLNGNANISVEDNTRYITGSSGYIQKSSILNMPTLNNPGNIGIEITALNNLGNTIIRRYHEATNANGVSTIKRMFEVIPENPLTLPALVTYYYIDNEEERGGIPKAGINSVIFDNGSWNLLPTIQDTANNAITVLELTSFSLLSGSIGPFLPVEFLEFSVKNINEAYARLNWVTATEINNDFFTIQRSIDGLHFIDIGYIEGAGNSSNITAYEYDDLEPLNGTSYYRIKQTDFDGKIDYSDIKSVHFNQNNLINIYPNPSNLGVINITGVDKNNYISVVNQFGQKVFSSEKTSEIDEPFVLQTDNFSSGVYYLILNSNIEHTNYIKFIIY